MIDLWVRVNGEPIPQGSKTARVVNGRAVMWDANPKLKEWRSTVTNACLKAARDTNVEDGAVAVTIWAIVARPKTAKRAYPTVKPDIDKMARAILDGITDAAIWGDDAQVVELSIRKTYAAEGDEPGVIIHIGSMQ